MEHSTLAIQASPENSSIPSLPDRPDGTRLNLGCGSISKPGFLGVDIGEGSAVDVRMDVMQYLRSLPPHSVQ